MSPIGTKPTFSGYRVHVRLPPHYRRSGFNVGSFSSFPRRRPFRHHSRRGVRRPRCGPQCPLRADSVRCVPNGSLWHIADVRRCPLGLPLSARKPTFGRQCPGFGRLRFCSRRGWRRRMPSTSRDFSPNPAVRLSRPFSVESWWCQDRSAIPDRLETAEWHQPGGLPRKGQHDQDGSSSAPCSVSL